MKEENRTQKSPEGLGGALIRLAAVLFCLVLVSTAMLFGLYARYSSSAQGSDSARVAKFDVNTAFDNKDITINCTDTDTGAYVITVDNQSEVAIKYVMIVTLVPSENNPAITLVEDDMNAYMADQKDADGNYIFKKETFNADEMKFTRDTPLMPGEKREHALKLEVKDWKSITGKVSDVEAIDWTFKVSVTVKAEQVD